MKLPKAELATVPEENVTRYRLNAAHSAGGGKASFFLRFGFSVADWRRLAEARYGKRYVVDGPLAAPDGTSLNVRSAWYIDAVGDAPRFVTAHPLQKV